MKGVTVLPPHVKFRIRNIINLNGGRKKRSPWRKLPDRLQELKNYIRGEILLKVSSWVLAHAVISLRFWSRACNANQNPACERKDGRSCREKGQTPARLQMATLRRWGSFETQEVKDSLFFFQLSSVSGYTVWSLMGSRLKIHKWVCSQPEAKQHPASLHPHVLWAKFRPPELVGRLRFLTDVGRHSSSPAEAVTNTTHFLQEVKLN